MESRHNLGQTPGRVYGLRGKTMTGNALLDLDDDAFCELLMTLLRAGDDAESQLGSLWEPSILQRLQNVKYRNPHIFVGSFLVPFREAFPRHTLSELELAMQGARGTTAEAADVLPEQLIAAIAEHVRHGGMRGAGPGWVNLGMHYTVRLGEMTIVTGVGSHMKSTFMQALCVNLARSLNWQFAMFSPEHASPGDLGTQLMERWAETEASLMPDEQILASAIWVSQHFHVIAPGEEDIPTLPYLLDVARHQVQRYGLHGLILDPWNEITHVLRSGQTETQYISEALAAIRRFAREHQIHAWVIAHPTKLVRVREDAKNHPYAGKIPPPTPYDIAGSAHWFNKADNCLSIWRDTDIDSPIIEVHIQKVRNRSVGRPGMIELTFRDQQFHEANPADDGQWNY